MDEKKKYRVTNPVSWGGRRERGEILELTEKEAIDIGEVELVVNSPSGFPDAADAAKAAASEVPAAPTDGDYAPVLSAEEQAEADAKAKEVTPEEAKAPEATATPEMADASNSVNA